MIGSLAATGRVAPSEVAAALAAVTATPPAGQAAGCLPSHHADEAPATDWMMIQALPTPGPDEATPAPLLLVELGGCHRVIAGASTAVLGYLGADAGAALSALAGDPVS
jgi:hypothetical protein